MQPRHQLGIAAQVRNRLGQPNEYYLRNLLRQSHIGEPPFGNRVDEVRIATHQLAKRRLGAVPSIIGQ